MLNGPARFGAFAGARYYGTDDYYWLLGLWPDLPCCVMEEKAPRPLPESFTVPALLHAESTIGSWTPAKRV